MYHGWFVIAGFGAFVALLIYLALRVVMLKRYVKILHTRQDNRRENSAALRDSLYRLGGKYMRLKDANRMLESRSETVEDILVSLGDGGLKDGIAKVMNKFAKTWKVEYFDEFGELVYERSRFWTDIEDYKRVEIPLNLGGSTVFYLPNEPTDRGFQRLATLARVSHAITVLVQNAEKDKKTGLWNHAHFMTELVSEVAIEDRYPKHPLSVMIIDIDYFKRLNDTYGHGSVDRMLRTLGEILNSHFRKTDVVARVGGDEFAVILRETTAAEAKVQAARLRKKLNHTNFEEIGGESLSISVGIAEYQEGDTAELLYGLADEAMYRAKRRGRNSVSSARYPQKDGK